MKKKGILCVANWDSDVGFAWWLMEGFWVEIAKLFGDKCNVYLAYPTISKVPRKISESSLIVKEFDFGCSQTPLSLAKKMSFLSRYNIEYIYFSDRSFVRLEYALFRLAGVRSIVIHDHSPGIRTIPAGAKRILKSLYSRLPFFSCDLVIGATEFVRKRCIDASCFPERKCYAANNGIPISCHVNEAINIKKELGIPEERILVVGSGRINLYKGIDFAIHVISCLAKKNIEVHYVYFGDGPDLEKIVSMAKAYGISERVSFPGKQNDIHSYLTGCDIAFHPSKGEVGYSLSILEYMRACLPVVVPSNESVCGAVVNGLNGYVYEDGNAESAMESLSELIMSKEKRELMGSIGRNMLLESYSIETCHEKLRYVLKRCFVCC